MVNSKAPEYLNNLVPPPISNRTHHNLRNRNDLHLPPTSLECHTWSFLPATTKTWNTVNQDLKNAPSVAAFKAGLKRGLQKSDPLYSVEPRHSSVHQCRMRMGFSSLRHDLFRNWHVVDNPNCRCGHGVESVEHFLLKCHLYNELRKDLLTNIGHLVTKNPPSLQTMLKGDPRLTHNQNVTIFSHVQTYIERTKRFS
jgi:hypothetical protein